MRCFFPARIEKRAKAAPPDSAPGRGTPPGYRLFLLAQEKEFVEGESESCAA